jgi:hypothetical protein
MVNDVDYDDAAPSACRAARFGFFYALALTGAPHDAALRHAYNTYFVTSP